MIESASVCVDSTVDEHVGIISKIMTKHTKVEKQK
jgi:hypothetical protein